MRLYMLFSEEGGRPKPIRKESAPAVQQISAGSMFLGRASRSCLVVPSNRRIRWTGRLIKASSKSLASA